MADTPESSPKKKGNDAQLTTATMPANSSKFSIQSLLGLGEGGSKPSRGGSVSSNTSEDDAELQYDSECSGEYIYYTMGTVDTPFFDRRHVDAAVLLREHTGAVGCRAAVGVG